MMKTSEIDALKQICEEAKKEGRLTGNQLAKLFEALGTRFSKAWAALREGRIKKYVFKPSGRVVWIVVGKERDYLIMPAAEFCTCDDYYFRVMDREVHLCYHLIAQKMAEALNWFDLFEEHDELYETLMKEWSKVTP